VSWTGPNEVNDYVTIVAAGATKWTNEPYFYTRSGTPGTLPAPIVAGDYELWYVNGADGVPAARQPITVTAFAGTLEAPAQVAAGSPFEVAWTGPNGPSDYVTIVAVGATRWTNEHYFYTANGSPGELIAPIKTGAHEVWYVTGQDPTPQVRRPITVTPFEITLEAPATVSAGADFQVTWTGPNGPSDYITIVPAGSPAGTYLDYAYTASGSTVTLTAPVQAGNYEVWYASDRVAGIFASIPIVVQ
jgi:Ca-activated chloride channel family protein